MAKESNFPSIVFDVAGSLFSVNSTHIAGIVQLQDYTRDANAVGALRGMMQYRGRAITLYDLRMALGLGSLEDEYEQFAGMIDARKGDHERWVAALEKTVFQGAPFTLATDPHKCALGKWRDSYQTDLDEVRIHLKQLDTPHGALHRSALEVLELLKDPSKHRAAVAIYQNVHDVFMPSVLAMLDELKHLFRDTVFREMVLLLNNPSDFGIIVERIHSVEYLEDLCDALLYRKFSKYNYVTSIKRSPQGAELIADMDVEALLRELCAGPPAGETNERNEAE